MKVTKPDYNESIVNVVNSIYKFYGVSQYHPGLKDLDIFLQDKNYDHVILMVLDGLGYYNLKELLPEDAFLRKHLKRSISSVFPPTTVAATTSLQTGLTPIEHGWLGWNVYVKPEDDILTLFLNRSMTTGEFFNEPVVKNHLGYLNAYHKIPNESGVSAYGISPYENVPYDFSRPLELFENIKKLTNKEERSYIYAYYENPDGLMHEYGITHDKVKASVQFLNNQIEDLSKSVSNSLIIVTADHGHVNVENVYLNEYPELEECLIREPSIEPRAVNFFVKEDQKVFFEKRFNEVFAETFVLYSKEDYLKEAFFGVGTPHPLAMDALGDYIAISISNLCLITEGYPKFKGHHAGGTTKEMKVPLILIETE